MNGSVIILLTAAGVISLAAAGTAVWRRRKYGAEKRGGKAPSVKERTGGDTESLAEAKAEFLRNCRAFTGIYEPVYRAANHRLKNMRSLFGDWNVRISYLQDAKSLQQLWNQYFSSFENWDEEMYAAKAKSLLELLSGFGVKRANTVSLTVDSKTYSEYTAFDGELIEAGTEAVVLSPCWTIHEEVLEKGLIRREQEGGVENA